MARKNFNQDSANQPRPQRGKGKGRKGGVDRASVNRGDSSYPRRIGSPHPDYINDRDGSPADNDAMWYALNAALLTDTASYSYGYALGRPLQTGNPYLDVNSIPGVMAFYLSPTFGNSTDGFSALNVAARNIYARVRYANSGSANYESTDLMIYLMAMDSVYSYLSYIRRIYGVARTYSNVNQYYPYALLRAMGMDPDDVQNNLNNFRSFINVFTAKVLATAVPATMPYMVRHMWMYDHVYVDSDTQKPQTYLYTPHAFYQYQLDANGKGMLLYNPLPSGQSTVAEIIAYGNQLIAEIMNDEDFGIMSGDILKAFNGNIIKLSFTDENYMVLPEYNKEVLSQMENMTMNGYYRSTTAGETGYIPQLCEHVMQQVIKGAAGLDSYLMFQPKVQTYGLGGTLYDANVMAPIIDAWSCRRIINMHHGDVTPADTMVATRLTNPMVYNPGATAAYTDGYYTCPALGSEICHSAIVYYYGMQDGTWGLKASLPYHSNFFRAVNQTAGSAAGPDAIAQAAVSAMNTTNQFWKDLASAFAPFDWHPQIMLYVLHRFAITGSDPGSAFILTSPSLPLMDYDNFAYIAMGDLVEMAHSAILSEFNVPSIGSMQK